MREPRRAAVLALTLSAVSCSTVSALRPSPPLFGDVSAAQIDFEAERLGEKPKGFDGAESWRVVDSPTAASGAQVLVRRGEEAARLTLRASEKARRLSAEAAVRVLIGTAGAGLSCRARDQDLAYLVQVEPDRNRAALYRRRGEASTEVSSRSIRAAKGEWVRLGILCGGDRVVAYANGKAIADEGVSLAAVELALWVDAGVTAQFDDLRFAITD